MWMVKVSFISRVEGGIQYSIGACRVLVPTEFQDDVLSDGKSHYLAITEKPTESRGMKTVAYMDHHYAVPKDHVREIDIAE